MARPLEFGTYVPGSSPIHAANTQVKLILACVFSLVPFFIETWLGLAVLALVTGLAYLMAHVPVRKAFVGFKAIAFVLGCIVVFHSIAPSEALQSAAADALVCELPFGVAVSAQGALRGCFIAVRIALLFTACSLLSFTTPQLELARGISALVAPLRHIHVPVEDVSTVIAAALRFVPLTTRELRVLVLAQRARCAPFGCGTLPMRARAWIRVISPLFVRMFKRAGELGDAMDIRCYGMRAPRKRRWNLKAQDAVLLVCGCAGALALGVLF